MGYTVNIGYFNCYRIVVLGNSSHSKRNIPITTKSLFLNEKNMEYKFKITKAEVKGEEVIVSATFFKGEEEVKEINHAFSRELSADEIRGEVVKALDLYVSELKQIEEDKIVQEQDKKDNELINNLINN